MNHFKSAAATAAILLLCAKSVFAGEILTSADLKHMVPGRYQVTLLGTVSMTITMRPNGTVLGSTNSSKDSGRWNLSGNKLCIAWNRWLGGQARCSGLTAQSGYFQGNGFTFKRI